MKSEAEKHVCAHYRIKKKANASFAKPFSSDAEFTATEISTSFLSKAGKKQRLVGISLEYLFGRKI